MLTDSEHQLVSLYIKNTNTSYLTQSYKTKFAGIAEQYNFDKCLSDSQIKLLKTSKYVVGGSNTLSFEDTALSFYSRSSYAPEPGEIVFVSYSVTGDTDFTYSCTDADGEPKSGIIAENVQKFEIISEGGNDHLPNNVTIKLEIGKSSTDYNTFVKSVYIGGRGQ